MSNSTPSPLAVAETAAFVMIGAAAELHRCLPAFVSEQRSKWDRQVVLARFLGQMAVGKARQEIRRRLAESAGARTRTDATGVAEAAVATRADEASATSTGESAVENSGALDDQACATGLGIDHYDELSASQVIERLPRLDDEQLSAVHDYESQHRRRRTVLGRVEQLRSARPGSSG